MSIGNDNDLRHLSFCQVIHEFIGAAMTSQPTFGLRSQKIFMDERWIPLQISTHINNIIYVSKWVKNLLKREKKKFIHYFV